MKKVCLLYNRITVLKFRLFDIYILNPKDQSVISNRCNYAFKFAYSFCKNEATINWKNNPLTAVYLVPNIL